METATDTRTIEQRSRIMRAVKTADTGPEMIVRRVLHAMGFRYRLHAKELPGRPDIVFRKRKKAIFVHGCFWHGHGCKTGKAPKSKLEYWLPKIAANKARDERNVSTLQTRGWSVLNVWQCELKDTPVLRQSLSDFVISGENSIDTDR
jgi:DNA mismatch endonuclease (patch repair protein)